MRPKYYAVFETLALLAGFDSDGDHLLPDPGAISIDQELMRFAVLVAKAEREKCAKVCESTAPSVRAYSPAFWDGCDTCAEAIRAMED